MKKDTHPQWYPQTKVTCSCGAAFTIGSTLPELTAEICSACHPFYTGKQKLIDTEGRVERFERRRQVAKTKVTERKIRVAKKTAAQEKRVDQPQTLKEMLKATRR